MPEEKYVDNRYSHQQEQIEEQKSQLIKQGKRLVGKYFQISIWYNMISNEHNIHTTSTPEGFLFVE